MLTGATGGWLSWAVVEITVKACCTAPSLNPNKKPQKNKARPKRPQFFLPGLLKVALFPGHSCAWNRRRIDPPKFEKARQCVSLHTNAVLAGRGMRAHAPRSGDRKVRRLEVRRPMWVRRPGPETKRPGGRQWKRRASATYTCRALYRAVQGGWVGFK